MSGNKPKIDVIFSPAMIPFTELEGKIAVVIDILRATTTMCEALHNGATAIIPVNSVQEARGYKEKGMITAAERDGVPVQGFDLGNSPQEFTPAVVAEKNIVLTTTNGTKALLRCKDAEQVLIGSFFNLTVLSNYLIAKQKEVLLVCAGWKDQFNLEDTMFAGAVLDKTRGHFNTDSDAVAVTEILFKNAQGNLHEALKNCNHARRFAHLGIDDLGYCLQVDRAPLIPQYKNGAITILQQAERKSVA